MREITVHKVNSCNEAIKVEVLDNPGSGGACHLYHITGFNSGTNPSDPWTKRHGQPAEHSTILFQNGPVAEVGTNGITHEVLLAILIDRLKSFQNGQPGDLALTAKGPFACRENALALTKLEEAMHWLHHRTLNRVARGVEGTHQK